MILDEVHQTMTYKIACKRDTVANLARDVFLSARSLTKSAPMLPELLVWQHLGSLFRLENENDKRIDKKKQIQLRSVKILIILYLLT